MIMSLIRKVLAIFICFAGICVISAVIVPNEKQDRTGDALRAIRALMETGINDSGKISAYIIPNEDEHQV